MEALLLTSYLPYCDEFAEHEMKSRPMPAKFMLHKPTTRAWSDALQGIAANPSPPTTCHQPPQLPLAKGPSQLKLGQFIAMRIHEKLSRLS